MVDSDPSNPNPVSSHAPVRGHHAETLLINEYLEFQVMPP